MGFTEAVNDSIYASPACLIIGLGYTPLSITRSHTPICILPQHSCFVSKNCNKFVIVKHLIFMFFIFYHTYSSLTNASTPHRRVWGGVQRAAEAAREAGRVGRHQDVKSGLHGEAEAGLPVRGEHHGAVRPSQRCSFGRRRHKR